MTYVGGRGNNSKPPVLKLQTLSQARETYASVIEQYATGEMSENQARALGYLLSGILAYYREERNQDLEERIVALEKQAGGV